jgi:hypothetical protein
MKVVLGVLTRQNDGSLLRGSFISHRNQAVLRDDLALVVAHFHKPRAVCLSA